MDQANTSTKSSPRTDRRQFLRQTGAAVVGAAALGISSSRAAGANERIVLGVIGPGGQGTGLLRSFAAQRDVEIAYVCDADANRLLRRTYREGHWAVPKGMEA